MLDQTRTTCATQQSYYDLWSSSNLETLTPTQLAEQGGRLADRAAWVFVGAYQGAMRQCFGQLRARAGWSSYLVSESRDESRAPTCALRQATAGADGFDLQGTKSWVAARSHLSTLVVNASLESGNTADVVVPVNTKGVELIEKPSGRFLPELAVGQARFDQVTLPGSALIEGTDSHVALFGLIEARCLLVALAGHFNELVPAADEPGEALLLASGLTTAELGQSGSIKILLESMTLLADWFSGWADSDVVGTGAAEVGHLRTVQARWADDRRLLEMHRPLLEKKLEKRLKVDN